MEFHLELIAASAGTAACLVFLWLHRDDSRHDEDDPTAFIFSADDDTDGEKRPYCAVCLNNISGGERCRKLTECRHCFHVDCVDAWIQNHSTCPLCRTQVSGHLFRREYERGVLDFFVSWSEIILDKICNPLNQELSSMLCEGMHGSRQGVYKVGSSIIKYADLFAKSWFNNFLA
nr:RING-H2 finger protein ATL2-like [Ipomoea batatas]